MKFELFGLPGSGKTSLCKKIKKKYKIKNPMDFYKYNFFGKILFHIFLSTFYFNKSNIKLFKELMSFLGDGFYKNIIDNTIDIELYIKYIVFVNYIEQKKGNYVIDEGIIHYCIALYAEYNVDFKIIDIILEKTNVENIKVGLKCSINKAMEQIKIRNRKSCPIDFLEEEKLFFILKKYNDAINYYRDKYSLLSNDEIENLINLCIDGGRNL